MYVRCPYDLEDVKDPRTFLTGQIVKIDEYSEMVSVKFHDPFGFRRYYDFIPVEQKSYFTNRVQRCELFLDTFVKYNNEVYKVIEIQKEREELYYYYMEGPDKSIALVCEDMIQSPFTSGRIQPSLQMSNYEFQNPCWYFGRYVVGKTMHVLENSIFGLKQLAGCKIYLMPHQIHTIMRCLQDTTCRYILADEVGLGKTIEACSILKIYLAQNAKKKILIIVPSALLEQWRVELFTKFEIIPGYDKNENNIKLLSYDMVDAIDKNKYWDFIIVDEIHRVLGDSMYDQVFKLSMNSRSMLLLSATPVQQKRQEYLQLLRLVLPERYNSISEDEFSTLVSKQKLITKKTFNILLDLEDYQSEISDRSKDLDDSEVQNLHEDEEIEELFDELYDGLEEIAKVVCNDHYVKLIKKVNYLSDDFGITKIQTALSYICENYQIEKSIIRSRRGILPCAKRSFFDLSYSLDQESNLFETNTYNVLIEWIQELDLSNEEFNQHFISLLGAFFSSPWAFDAQLNSSIFDSQYHKPDDLTYYAERWKRQEENLLEEIDTTLEDPDLLNNRILQVFDYIDQNITTQKVVLFTNYKETYEVYHKYLNRYFGDKKCCFFHKEMDREELEISVYRFQTDQECTIMLCDPSGGEGRNFQNADYILHIDLPWDANAIEQRIGRLDRIGRDIEKDVISVVVYEKGTLEEQLFKFWNEGLQIFSKSLSGLEIIMGEINTRIIDAVLSNFKYGLEESISDIIELSKEMEKSIREEQYFDIAAFQFKPLNKELDKAIRYYSQNENELFAQTMLRWASLAGLRAQGDPESDRIAFNENSFSLRSAENVLLIPPNWDSYINNKRNAYATKVKELYEERYASSQNKRITTRAVEGTFNREIAIKNDLLHFFAPGDEIFNCIVDNALHSCKGQATAFAIMSNINWKGLIFTWSIRPNLKILMDHKIPVNMISQYRSYLAIDQVNTVVPTNSSFGIKDEVVLKEFNRIINTGFLKSKIAHLGQRGKSGSFLNINTRYGVSNLEWFKETHLPSAWEPYVNHSAKVAYKKAIEQFKSKSHIADAKAEIQRMIATGDALNMFYENLSINTKRNEEVGNILFEALSKPIITMESVSYIWMVNQNESNK